MNQPIIYLKYIDKIGLSQISNLSSALLLSAHLLYLQAQPLHHEFGTPGWPNTQPGKLESSYE